MEWGEKENRPRFGDFSFRPTPLGSLFAGLSVIIQMKGTEHYVPVVLFIMLYKVVLTLESVEEILLCDHSNESY